MALAHANFQAALLTASIGSLKDAADAYEQAREGYAKLVAEQPDDLNALARLAKCLHNQGVVLTKLGRGEQARRTLEETIAIEERLVRARPGVVADRKSLATSQDALGNFSRTLGEQAKAEGLLRTALQARRELARKSPDDLECKADLAMSLGNLEVLSRNFGRDDECANCCAKRFRSKRKSSVAGRIRSRTRRTWRQPSTTWRLSSSGPETPSKRSKPSIARSRFARNWLARIPPSPITRSYWRKPEATPA